MKQCVNILLPYIESNQQDHGMLRVVVRNSLESKHAGKVLIATVKGDVHDIGKNIVSVVLACNNFEVKDLGVMVDADTIVQVYAIGDYNINRLLRNMILILLLYRA